MAVKKKKSRKVTSRVRGTRKSAIKKKRQTGKFDRKFIWIRRVSIICVAIAAICWVGAWFFLSDVDSRATNWIRQSTLSVTADVGFRVENIMVEGRRYSDADLLLAMINIKKGDPIFFLNPNEAKQQIERIGWIKSARVERRLPDTIYIKLEERRPLVLWQNNGKLSLIDSEGEILEVANLDKFKDLLMIRGKGAPSRAEDLAMLLDGEPDLKARVDQAELIDVRRWDLYLNDGKRIKLPETDIGLALRSIMVRQEQEDILGMNFITVIDARYKGRLIVRTKLGKVQDYKAGMDASGKSL